MSRVTDERRWGKLRVGSRQRGIWDGDVKKKAASEIHKCFPKMCGKRCCIYGAKAPTAAGRGAGADAHREFVASSLHQIVSETKAVVSYLFVRRGNYPMANSGLQFFTKSLLFLQR